MQVHWLLWLAPGAVERRIDGYEQLGSSVTAMHWRTVHDMG
jgi:hypothetical protein